MIRRWCMNMLCNLFSSFHFALRAVEVSFWCWALTVGVERAAGVGCLEKCGTLSQCAAEFIISTFTRTIEKMILIPRSESKASGM